MMRRVLPLFVAPLLCFCAADAIAQGRLEKPPLTLPITVQVVARVINVTAEPYKVKCDGVTDNTAALRSAQADADTFPYRSIALPSGTCRVTDTVVFGGRTDRYSSISMFGQGEYATLLLYDGPMDRPALLVSHMAAFTWHGFAVSSTNVTSPSFRGSSVGIQFDGPFNSGGTMNVLTTLDHVLVAGFHINMRSGGGDAASELECRQCVLAWADVGWTANNYNSLNFWFYGVHLLNNVVGMKLGGPWVTDAPHIIGGTSAGNTVADFELGNTFGVLSIANFRAEIQAGAKFLSGGGGVTMVSIRDSTILAADESAAVMDVSRLHLDTSIVRGRLVVPWDHCHPSAWKGVITIEDSAVTHDPVTGYPLWFTADSGGNYRFRFINNRPSDFAVTEWLPNRSGTWVCGYVEPE